MKIYNSQVLNHQQRFWVALVVGLVSAIGLAFIYAWLSNILFLELEVLYIGIGWLIGIIIQKVGRGVQVRFQVMAALLTILCFILGDMMTTMGYSILFNPSSWFIAFRYVVGSLFGLSLSALLRLAFRIAGILIAYQNGRFF